MRRNYVDASIFVARLSFAGYVEDQNHSFISSGYSFSLNLKFRGAWVGAMMRFIKTILAYITAFGLQPISNASPHLRQRSLLNHFHWV